MKTGSFSAKYFILALSASMIIESVLIYLELSPLIVLMGFRLYIPHLALMIYIAAYPPVLSKKIFFPLGLNTLILMVCIWLIGTGAVYFGGMVKFADPDFLYELGLTSIIDFPVYLIWNSVFFLTPFLFLRAVSKGKNITPVWILAIIPLLYIFPVFQLLFNTQNTRDYYYAGLILISAIVLFKFSPTVSSFVISGYFLLWINLVAFGTSSQFLLQVILASKYETWEGLFTGEKSTLLIIQSVLTLFTLFAFTLSAVSFSRKRNMEFLTNSKSDLN